jgi:Cobyric acid synthase
MGSTRVEYGKPHAIELEDNVSDGAVNADGSVFGTYLHGIFENDEFRKRLLSNIRSIRGIEQEDSGLSYHQLKEIEYDKLADGVRNSLDMQAIRDIIGL